ncbi:MAG TPA: glycoside hydrolase family 97 N-terminal domain-containing protein, partial [Longimicrobiales bacterium]
MTKRLILAVVLMASEAAAQQPATVSSPDGRTAVTVFTHNGQLFYRVQRDRRDLMMPSQLGFVFRNAPPLRDSLRITGTQGDSADQTWTQPWGEVARVRDNHRQVRVSVQEGGSLGRRFDMVFRVFNDGIGFR